MMTTLMTASEVSKQVNYLCIGRGKLLLQFNDAGLGRDAIVFLRLKVSTELLSLFHQQLYVVVMVTG